VRELILPCSIVYRSPKQNASQFAYVGIYTIWQLDNIDTNVFKLRKHKLCSRRTAKALSALTELNVTNNWAASNAWCSRCLSVCLSVTQPNSASLCKNSWTNQDPVWCEHSWGPRNIVLDVGSWSPTAMERGIRCNLRQITLAICFFKFHRSRIVVFVTFCAISDDAFDRQSYSKVA